MATKRVFRRNFAFYVIGSMRIPVKVRLPRAPISINGCAEDALSAFPGVTVGCAISRAAWREENASSLPFKLVAMPQITSRTALFPTKLNKNGQPCEGVMYEHNYRNVVDANDRGTLKRMVRKSPEIMARSLTFYPPVTHDTHKPGHRNIGLRPARGPSKTRGKVAQLKGAALRALRAGLITKPVYDAMRRGNAAVS